MAPIVLLFRRISNNMANQVLEKREDDGSGIDFDLPPGVIMLLCMIASMVLLLMAYGIGRFWGNFETPNLEPTAAQVNYMRQVRDRNLDNLMVEGAAARHELRSARTNTQSYVSAGPSERR